MNSARKSIRLVFIARLMIAMAIAVFISPRGGSVSASSEEPGACCPVPESANSPTSDARLKGAYRFEKGGWVYLHLQGSPGRIGFQHGFLLAPEIEDAFQSVKLDDTHTTQRDWEFFRQAAREMLWPKIDPEYQAELKGIVEGLKAKGVAMDLDDLVALNAFEELPGYYVPWYNSTHKVASAPHLVSP